jgi:LmbE family N-acetylglucosaminyl deacetylase
MSPEKLKIVVVSPHPDDAALSCGGLLRMARDAHLTIVSCFTRSAYAPLDAAHGHRSRVTELRQREDQAYAECIGADLVSLPLPDTSVRHGPASDPDRGLDEEPAFADELLGRLGSALAETPADWLLSPLGIGRHRDHVLVRDALRQIEPPMSLLFYEDLPYGAWVGGPSEVEVHAATFAEPIVPYQLEVGDVFAQKLTDVCVYASQAPDSWRASVADYARDLSAVGGFAERLWLLEAGRDTDVQLVG